jgi:hypothetical protein
MTQDDFQSKRIFIPGFSLSGYRSFGTALQEIGPLGRLNLFIGPNNCGKSNVLRFVHHWYSMLFQKANSLEPFGYLDRVTEPADSYQRSGKIDATIEFWIDQNQPEIQALQKKFVGSETALFKKFLTAVTGKHEMITVCYLWKAEGTQQNLQLGENVGNIWTKLPDGNDGWWRIANRLECRVGTGQQPDLYCRRAISQLTTFVPKLPPVHFIPHVRSIGKEKISDRIEKVKNWQESSVDGRKNRDHHEDESVWSGDYIIDQLARLQNPGGTNVTSAQLNSARMKFEALNEFAEEVLGASKCRLQANYERDTILVDLETRVFPIEELGTGIHEVILLAIAATLAEPGIFCIEEPELHLHPTLQRRLMQYLLEKTAHQFFITTHSPSLIDVPGATIFQVSFDNAKETTTISKPTKPQELFDVSIVLGHRPSDLMQANCVIWVEGPSDRIYLNKWITFTASELIEGAHYSIMVYGGALKTHFETEDDDSRTVDIDSFIKLRRLSRRSVVLSDRDAESDGKERAEVHKRLAEGYQSDGESSGFLWVTAGRTIENYISEQTLKRTADTLYGNKTILPSRPLKKPDHRWNIAELRPQAKKKTKDGLPTRKIKGRDKINLAREIVGDKKYEIEWDHIGLKKEIERLVKFIRESNSHTE